MARTVWRLLDAVFALLFVLAVIVNLNDPDPIAWVLIYAAAAWTSFLAVLGRPSRALASAVAAVAKTTAQGLSGLESAPESGGQR